MSRRDNQKNQKDSIVSAIGKVVGVLAIGALAFFGGYLLGGNKKQTQQQNGINNIQTTSIEEYDNMQQLMTCPISQQIMINPALITQCGHTFEKKVIEQWLTRKKFCPLCKIETDISHVKINFHLKNIIEQYHKEKQLNNK